MTTIYLLRHGQYEPHDGILPYRLSDFHLSQKGKEDVHELATKLSSKPIVAVYTSPLERTFETAIILAKSFGLTPIIDERLLEVRSPAQGEKEGFVKSKGGWGIYETEWYKEHDGESMVEIVARMKSAFEEFVFKHEGKEIIVVSHGDPIMLTAAYYQGIALESSALGSIPYVPMVGGFRLAFEAGEKPTVVVFSSYSIAS